MRSRPLHAFLLALAQVTLLAAPALALPPDELAFETEVPTSLETPVGAVQQPVARVGVALDLRGDGDTTVDPAAVGVSTPVGPVTLDPAPISAPRQCTPAELWWEDAHGEHAPVEAVAPEGRMACLPVAGRFTISGRVVDVDAAESVRAFGTVPGSVSATPLDGACTEKVRAPILPGGSYRLAFDCAGAYLVEARPALMPHWSSASAAVAVDQFAPAAFQDLHVPRARASLEVTSFGASAAGPVVHFVRLDGIDVNASAARFSNITGRVTLHDLPWGLYNLSGGISTIPQLLLLHPGKNTATSVRAS